MKIKIENIGALKFAEYELADLTIFCGENNTGKTYATYAMYGFFNFWKKGFDIKVPQEYIDTLMQHGSASIPLKHDQKSIDEIMKQACKEYKRFLPKIFAAKSTAFKDSGFSVQVLESEINILDTYNKGWGAPIGGRMIQVSKESCKDEISVNFVVEAQVDFIPHAAKINLENIISGAIKKIMFGKVFPDVFIASAERTGVVFFKNELNLEKNTLLKEISENEDINLRSIINKFYSSNYALPVKHNIDFIRKLETVSKHDSYIVTTHPEILNYFNDIIKGTYNVSKEGLYYTPSGEKVKLTMGESSSSVRALIDLVFYLRHAAEEGNLLIIDEPELNLHPKNQRIFARVLAHLANIGIKVFITTHSDYIIKEINTLIMLSGSTDKENSQKIMDHYRYTDNELIKPEKIKVYISEKKKVLLTGNKSKTMIQTLVPAEIDIVYGIEARSFDDTINEMNKIQKSIILGY